MKDRGKHSRDKIQGRDKPDRFAFPSTALPITGTRLSSLAKTITNSNFPVTDGANSRHPIALHGDRVNQSFQGPMGARYYLSAEEGEGFWDILQIRDGLALSAADAIYYKPKPAFWPTDPVLKVRISLSGTMRFGDGNIVTGDGECSLHCLSGRQIQNYTIDAQVAYQVVTVHAQLMALQSMGLDIERLGAPLSTILRTGTFPDLLVPAPASVTLHNLAMDIIRSRDVFMADTRRLYLAAKAEEILIAAIEQTRPQSTIKIGANKINSRDLSRLNEARRILEVRYASPPTIDELARMVGINATKLKLGFREIQGESIREFINRLRMETALSLVENSDLSFAEIAFTVGYAHPTNFTQAFKRRFGMSPRMARHN
jgi:AraC-like DNA-binding protein